MSLKVCNSKGDNPYSTLRMMSKSFFLSILSTREIFILGNQGPIKRPYQELKPRRQSESNPDRKAQHHVIRWTKVT